MRRYTRADFITLDELIAKLPPETQAAIEAESKAFMREWHLNELRKQLGKTQVELGEKSGIKQAEISRIERHPETTQIRTLERYLAGLGGSLRLVAEFPDGTQAIIPLRHGKPVKSRVTLAETPITETPAVKKRA